MYAIKHRIWSLFLHIFRKVDFSLEPIQNNENQSFSTLCLRVISPASLCLARKITSTDVNCQGGPICNGGNLLIANAFNILLIKDFDTLRQLQIFTVNYNV